MKLHLTIEEASYLFELLNTRLVFSDKHARAIRKRLRPKGNKRPRVGTMPKVGEDVYARTSFYIDHGEDDFVGGLCQVSELKLGDSGSFSFSVVERPGHSYCYPDLKSFWEDQAKYKKEFGFQRGYKDPDFG